MSSPRKPMTESDPARWVDMLPQLENEARELETKLRATLSIINGIRALNGEPVVGPFEKQRVLVDGGSSFVAAPLDPQRPRGREAILEVMETEPYRLWKLIEIKRILLARGWAPSVKSVDANVKRMVVMGEIQNPRYGYYRLREQDAA